MLKPTKQHNSMYMISLNTDNNIMYFGFANSRYLIINELFKL